MTQTSPATSPRRPDLPLKSIVIHSLDPVVQARFWMVATGLPPHEDDVATVAGDQELCEGESICLTDGGIRLWLTRPEELPALHGRVHVDVAGDRDLVQRLLAAGGAFVREGDHRVVLEDPEGNAFCVEFDE